MNRSASDTAEGAQVDPPQGREGGRRPPLTEALPTPLWHQVAERLIGILALTAVLAIALIFLFIAREAFPLFWEAGVEEELNLRDLLLPKQWPGYDEPVAVWQPIGGTPKFNMIPLFVGSLKVTLLSMAMAVPLGVGCAIFVAIYAPNWLREVVKPAIELLAGVPSVVLGFFALMTVASFTQNLFGFTYRLNGFVAAVGLAMAITPVIFTISEDALQAVPKSLSEAAAALGARKYQIALRVTVPAAIPGITAAVILGFGRAIGETMIVLMASGNAAVVELFDFSTSVRTVTATIAAELGEVARGEPHWRVLFLLGVMLFAITFVLNLGGKWATDRLHRKLTAG
jgi:phosphate transport system permease protein